MSSLLCYNVENSTNKEKPLNELVCPNIWLVLYILSNVTVKCGLVTTTGKSTIHLTVGLVVKVDATWRCGCNCNVWGILQKYFTLLHGAWSHSVRQFITLMIYRCCNTGILKSNYSPAYQPIVVTSCWNKTCLTNLEPPTEGTYTNTTHLLLHHHLKYICFIKPYVDPTGKGYQ